MLAYQLMVIHYHQLDVLGFCLDGTLASPHLDKVWCPYHLHTGHKSHSTHKHIDKRRTFALEEATVFVEQLGCLHLNNSA